MPSTRFDGFARSRLLAVWAAVFGMAGAAAAQGTGPLLIVTSRDGGPYEGVVSGVRGVLEGNPKAGSIRVLSLENGREAAMEGLRQARSGAVPLVTVGSMAARAALEVPGDAPVVACMIGGAEDIGTAGNATGVMLEFPLETQLEWVRRFVPEIQTIGVLYNPAQNQKRIEDATKIASRLGLRLVGREVHRPQDLPDALDSLAREVDLLFAVTDQLVLSPQTAQAVLLFSFRNRMPFSGLSASWVKAGALYALERDYPDLGAQCAEMAVQLLEGKRASSLPPRMPRKVEYAVNLKTAERLKLKLASELVENAAQVFR